MSDVEKLRAMLANATPVPWRVREDDDPNGPIETYITGRTVSGLRVCSPSEPDDAELIAAAINALPRLLDVVEAAERLRAANDGGILEYMTSARPDIAYRDLLRAIDALKEK